MDSGEPQSVVSDYERLTSSFVLLLADVVSSSSSSSSFNNNNQFTSNKYVNICFIYILTMATNFVDVSAAYFRNTDCESSS